MTAPDQCCSKSESSCQGGAVHTCPKEGKGAALILPACNSEAMNLHLAEIAKAVAPATVAGPALGDYAPTGRKRLICLHQHRTYVDAGGVAARFSSFGAVGDCWR